MKKTAILWIVLCLSIWMTGCEKDASEVQKEPLKVYSFHGENDQFAISNGVFVINAEEEILYGGNIKEKEDSLSDLSSYCMNFYTMSGDEKIILMSNCVEDEEGNEHFFAETGQISGDLLAEEDAGKVKDNLYFELKAEDSKGRKKEYQLKLNVTEITNRQMGESYEGNSADTQ